MGHSSRVRLVGPLATHKDGLIAHLRGKQYTSMSGANLLRLTAHLSRWLSSKHLRLQDLTADRVDEFLRHRRRAGYTGLLTCQGLRPFFDYLSEAGFLLADGKKVPEQTQLDKILKRYGTYLVSERALSPDVVLRYGKVARNFLSTLFRVEAPDFGRLTTATVSGYIVREVPRSGIGYAKLKVTALRSFLRYLYAVGEVTTDLSAALPAVAGWRLVGLPRALTPGEANKLLHSCDRRTRIGRRSYAVILLMLRLGLRACEVAALALNDVDWSRGELVVHGKGGRQDTLPVPQDVGAAVADYLRRGRPLSQSRSLFLSAHAPSCDMNPAMVKHIVFAAGSRCGFHHLGAHRLRHTAATLMLRHGASLPEIGRVLRHRNVDTTAIYAKVDLISLRTVCRPWPGAMR